MGQYYRIFMCEENGGNPRVYIAGDYDNCSKLTDHSYYKNEFVEVALSQLAATETNDNATRVWWVGDYADDHDIPMDKKKYKPTERAWHSDNLIKIHNGTFDFEAKLYLVNLEKKEYVDLLMAKKINTIENRRRLCVHPLPMLTAVGNGRGGGDYRGNNCEMVGEWAGDLLMVTDTVPLNYTDISNSVCFSH